MALRDTLLADLGPREERIKVLGHEVLVREPAAEEDLTALGFKDRADINYKWLIACTFDPQTGERVFTLEDLPALKSRGRAKLLPLILAVNRVNGFDLEDEEKNSGAVPSGG